MQIILLESNFLYFNWTDVILQNQLKTMVINTSFELRGN